jgi:hypothetical protein
MRRTVLVSLAIGACAAALAYSTSRAIQVWLFADPDPRTIIAPSRIAFFWRTWIALYAGTLAAIGAAALHRRAPELVDRRVGDVVMITAVLTTLQGVFLP